MMMSKCVWTSGCLRRILALLVSRLLVDFHLICARLVVIASLVAIQFKKNPSANPRRRHHPSASTSATAESWSSFEERKFMFTRLYWCFLLFIATTHKASQFVCTGLSHSSASRHKTIEIMSSSKNPMDCLDSQVCDKMRIASV
jgi:hypothetical protein